MQKRTNALLARYPEEVRNQVAENGAITFELYVKNINIKSRKIFCKFHCIVCNQEELVSTKALGKRIFIKEAVCRKCIGGFFTKKPEWLEKNSEAQKKIQSTPEQKLKNAIGVSNFWKNNPEAKKRVGEKISKRYQEDPEYRRKVNEGSSKNQFSLKGFFFFRKEFWIKFESSYELCFLVWAEQNTNIKKIRRCDFSIQYEFSNKKFNYFPDYVVFYGEQKVLTEIKSTRSFHFLNRKDKESAKIFSAENFIKENDFDRYDYISEEHDLSRNIGFKRSSGIKKMCKILYSEERMKLTSKRHIQNYIGVVENEN